MLARIFGFVVLAFASVSAAQAQLPTPNPFAMGYRIGVFMPTSSDGRDIGTSWFAAGVDFPLVGGSVPATGLGASSSISLDYYEKGGNRSIPLMANYVVRFQQFSYTSGVGLGFNRLAGGSEKTVIQYQMGLGLRLSSGGLPLTLEARYWRASDDELTGIGVYLGLKF